MQVARVPPEAVPEHSYDGIHEATGRMVAAPMRTGEAVTDRRLVQPGLLDGYPPESVLSTVRVADRAVLTGIGVGDRVDVIGADPTGKQDPMVIAHGVPVVSLPESAADRAPDAVVLLAVPPKAALDLAAATVRTRLSVVSVPQRP